MDKNVGGIDRTGRIVVGIVIAIAGIAALTEVRGESPALQGEDESDKR